MIPFVVGKPRSGKTYFAFLEYVVKVLKTTNKLVGTNMAIRLDRLQDWFDEQGHDIHVRDRIFMLDDEMTRDFWLYRDHTYKLPVLDDYAAPKGENLDFTPVFRDPRFRDGPPISLDGEEVVNLRGVVYIIDECHTIWPARGWQGTPRHLTFYLSQHGKLADDCVFITQNTKLVDSNLLRLAQSFTYCRNCRIEKFGRFRGENKFVAKTYPGPATTGNEVTLNVEEYKLDLAIANCYDTSAGVGMPGGSTADKGARAKGIPLKMVWVGLVAVLVVAWLVIAKGIPAFGRRYLGGAISGGRMDSGKAVASPVAPVVGAAGQKMQPAPTVPASPTVFVDAWAFDALGPIVWLTDGRTLRSGDIRGVARDGVVLASGEVFRFKTRDEAREAATLSAKMPPGSSGG